VKVKATTRTARPIPAQFDQHRFVHESLIEICDQLGEALAEAYGNEGRSQLSQLSAINKLVWQMRWELGMEGGHAVSLADLNESEVANG